MHPQRLLAARIDQRLTFQRFLSLLQFFEGLSGRQTVCLSVCRQGLALYTPPAKSAVTKASLFLPGEIFGSFMFFGGSEVPQADFELSRTDVLTKLMALYRGRWAHQEVRCLF